MQRVLEMMEMGIEENDYVQAWEVDTEGDQIMPQVGQVPVVVVEEMYQASIETRGGVTEMEIGVHTPSPGPNLCTETTTSIMTVLHTPLLGPWCTPAAAGSKENNPGGGFTELGGCAKSRRCRTDLRKPGQNLWSPNFSKIKLDKSPTVVGDRMEQLKKSST